MATFVLHLGLGLLMLVLQCNECFYAELPHFTQLIER